VRDVSVEGPYSGGYGRRIGGGADYNLGVAGRFQFERSVEFSPESSAEVLRLLPAGAGVLCLRGARAGDEPYLTRTADLRRRAMRLLAAPEVTEGGQPVLSKRLNLRGRVTRVEWTAVGSEFEALLVLYHAAAEAFGYAEARRRLRLHTPFFVRFTAEQAHPRVYATNRLSKRGLGEMYGPFPSRAAAERYGDAVLDLFKLRRCHEDLEPYPEHPGCVYQEMKKCLAPCNQACTAEEYAGESAAVKEFLATRGESMLGSIAAERERASEEMDFERAAALHQQWTKVKGAVGLADVLVRPVPRLRAVIVQASATKDERLEAAVFLLEGGCLEGPGRMSTLGVRAVKEQTSVGSSLFAQPLMLQAVPLEETAGVAVAADSPEERAGRVLGALEARVGVENDLAMVSDHLSLLRRWYYRPEKQRVGEIFFPNEDGSWPVRRILRGAARMVLGEPGVMAETNREGVAAAKVKILHEGREGVELVVPVIPAVGAGRRKRRGRAGVMVEQDGG
jgi:excinuclease ABC subunit C